MNRTAVESDLRTNQELLNAARDGDRLALAVYHARVMPGLRDKIEPHLRLCGRADWTEDILQAVLLKVLGIIRRSGVAESATPDLRPSWLFRTAQNIVVDWLRRERRKSSLRKAQEDQLTDPGERLEESRLAREQAEALLKLLPDKYAELMRLVYVDGLHISEAAEHLGLSIGAAYQIRNRGLARLRKAVRSDPQLARRISGD